MVEGLVSHTKDSAVLDTLIATFCGGAEGEGRVSIVMEGLVSHAKDSAVLDTLIATLVEGKMSRGFRSNKDW